MVKKKGKSCKKNGHVGQEGSGHAGQVISILDSGAGEDDATGDVGYGNRNGGEGPVEFSQDVVDAGVKLLQEKMKENVTPRGALNLDKLCAKEEGQRVIVILPNRRTEAVPLKDEEDTDEAMEVDEFIADNDLVTVPYISLDELSARPEPVDEQELLKSLNQSTQPQAACTTGIPFQFNKSRNEPHSTATLTTQRNRAKLRNPYLGLTRAESEPPTNYICIYHPCDKKAAVLCQGCQRLVYCTDKHRRKSKSGHEAFCIPYRLIESQRQGELKTIAARNLPRCAPIISSPEFPILKLPLLPGMFSRNVPSSYCIHCFADSKTGSNPKCPGGCGLPVCSTPVHQGISKQQIGWIPSHTSAECNYIAKALKRGCSATHTLYLDHHVLGLLRTMRITKNAQAQSILDFNTLVDRIGPATPGDYPRAFKSKLQFLRTLLFVDGCVATDAELYKIDQALLRFGRNIGPDTVTFDSSPSDFYVRCVYKNLAHVSHSCVPNSMLTVTPDEMGIHLYATSKIPKGDAITYCYDQRCLFLPTNQRRAFLFREFGFSCRCIRCTSPSEQNSYFSSNRCSRCRKGFLVPSNPTDEYSNWACEKCHKPVVSYIRVVDTNLRLKAELESKANSTASGLLFLLHELVAENLLHWNHHLVFEYSIRLLNNMFLELNKNETKLMVLYSKDRGQGFIKPAETVIDLTEMFMPDSYMSSYVLPLRFAGIIKLRDMLNRLDRSEISLQKLDEFVNRLYFRGFDVTRQELFNIRISANTVNINGWTRNLEVLECKIIVAIEKSVFKVTGGKPCSATGLSKLFNHSARVIEDMRATSKGYTMVTIAKDSGYGIFPYDFQV